MESPNYKSRSRHAEGRKLVLQRSPTDDRDLKYNQHRKSILEKSGRSTRAVIQPEVDLRKTPYLPAPLDQGQLGACASHAMSNCLRYHLKLGKVGDWQPSRLYIYYRGRVDIEGRQPTEDCGMCIRNTCVVANKFGVPEEPYLPYDISKFAIAPSKNADARAAGHKNIQYFSVNQTLADLKQALTDINPILCGIMVFQAFMSEAVASSGIVPMPDKTKEKPVGGHAQLLIGHSDAKQAFLSMNSWGRWGENQTGCSWIPYKYILDPELAFDFQVVKYFA